MTAAIQQLVADAKAAGLEVRHNTTVQIIRWVKVNKTSRRAEGIEIFDTGWAADLSVAASAQKFFRSVATMRQILGLRNAE